MQALLAWLVALMLLHSPLTRDARPKHEVLEARETQEERKARYDGIAKAVLDVSFDETEKPLFGGKHGRHQTAALLLGLSWMEGGWRRDVDLGLGKKARGGGTDTCNMQIRLSKDEKTAEGWGWEELVQDRTKCFRAGLRIVRRSMAACRELPVEERLAAYATGSCASERGKQKSRARMAVARSLLGRLPLPPLELASATAEPAPVAAKGAP